MDGQRSIGRLDDRAHQKAGILEEEAKTSALGEVIVVLVSVERHRHQDRKRTFVMTCHANLVLSFP